MKALVVRLSALGDVLHALPIALALEAEGHEVGWVVGRGARPLVADHPAIRRVHEGLGAVREIRRIGYDVAIDPQGLMKSAAIARLSGAPRRIGRAAWQVRERPAALLYTDAVKCRAAHVIDQNLDLLRPLGIRVPAPAEVSFGLEPLLPPPPSWDALDERPVALVVGGTWETKRWAADRWTALARSLRGRGLPAAVFWGGADLEEARSVSRESGAPLAPRTSFLEMAAAFRRCRLVVAVESGPLHLAAALGVPTVGLFGPTAASRNGAYRLGRAVEADVPCRPCHGRTCPTGRFVCMPSLEAEAVGEAVAAAAAAARA